MAARKKAAPRPVKAPPPPFVLPVLQGDTRQQLVQLWEGVPNGSRGWRGCTRCTLNENRKDDEIVFADGSPSAKIVILGEFPNEEEEAYSIPFMGPSGRLFNQILAETASETDLAANGSPILELAKWYRRAPKSPDNLGRFHDTVNEWRRREFLLLSAVACRPPSDRNFTRPPLPREVEACWERVASSIYLVDPWLIISCGKIAVESLMKKKSNIEKDRGHVIDVMVPGRLGPVTYPMMATHSPSTLMRKADWGTENGNFSKTVQDFQSALRIVDLLREKHLGIPAPKRGVQT